VKFLIDENLPADFAAIATVAGHEATWVRDLAPGATDRVILDRLRSSGEILVTRDVRFANMVFALTATQGVPRMVVLVREQLAGRLRDAWQRFLEHPREIHGIVVVSADRQRYRPATPADD
jgi:predicted nuclease of predicted toxin-antitoxin system